MTSLTQQIPLISTTQKSLTNRATPALFSKGTLQESMTAEIRESYTIRNTIAPQGSTTCTPINVPPQPLQGLAQLPPLYRKNSVTKTARTDDLDIQNIYDQYTAKSMSLNKKNELFLNFPPSTSSIHHPHTSSHPKTSGLRSIPDLYSYRGNDGVGGWLLPYVLSSVSYRCVFCCVADVDRHSCTHSFTLRSPNALIGPAE